jgi:hypothetical protein
LSNELTYFKDKCCHLADRGAELVQLVTVKLLKETRAVAGGFKKVLIGKKVRLHGRSLTASPSAKTQSVGYRRMRFWRRRKRSKLRPCKTELK